MASRNDKVMVGLMAGLAIALFAVIGLEALRGGKKTQDVTPVSQPAADSTKSAPAPQPTPAPANRGSLILKG